MSQFAYAQISVELELVGAPPLDSSPFGRACTLSVLFALAGICGAVVILDGGGGGRVPSDFQVDVDTQKDKGEIRSVSGVVSDACSAETWAEGE